MVIPAEHAYVVGAYYCFTFLPDLCMNVPEDSHHHFYVSPVQFYSFVDLNWSTLIGLLHIKEANLYLDLLVIKFCTACLNKCGEDCSTRTTQSIYPIRFKPLVRIGLKSSVCVCVCVCVPLTNSDIQ